MHLTTITFNINLIKISIKKPKIISPNMDWEINLLEISFSKRNFLIQELKKYHYNNSKLRVIC